ncbi:hypothetical protein [Nocardia sp. NPDC057272]|uniref:hypothetical protein n=1 Tax=Nocardia sp. NPDC057272 TaxID=3346079 RepID=UPI003630146D
MPDNPDYFRAAHKAYVGNHDDTLRELTAEEWAAVREGERKRAALRERAREIGELGGRADT